MFVGAINQHLRSILFALAKGWQGKRVYVGCSGNFTIERILSSVGVTDVHSNDVSLYSCLIGSHLCGRSIDLRIKDARFDWLTPFMADMPGKIATLMLCTEWFKFIDRDAAYYKRMDAYYRDNFAGLHAKTLSRIEPALKETKIAEFYAGDVVDMMQAAPRDSVFLSFPPTYEGGYEKLYKAIDAVFDWPAPFYTEFTEERFALFTSLLQSFDHWITLRDHEVAEMAPVLIAIIQTGLRSRPVYIYSNRTDQKFLAMPRQTLGNLPLPLCTGAVEGPLDLVPVGQPVMNTLRSMFLSSKITPASASWNFLLTAGTTPKIVGGIAFGSPRGFGDWCDVYMLTDFCIRPSPHKRLSKLVLAATLSTEIKSFLESKLCRRFKVIGTTAFTDRAISMKYRGLYEVHKRGEGMINYVAPAGRWSLQGALQWWNQTHKTA
jgi:hypothetical protein